MKKYILLLLTIILLSCSTKKNTTLSRGYQKMTTQFNVLFNGEQSFEAGALKIKEGHKYDYTEMLPIYLTQDESARSAAFSDMDRAAVKAMKAIKLHSITVKPRRKNKRTKKYIKFRKKSEYNDLIDDCYLLKGKSDYINKKYQKADKSFKFIIRQFPDNDIIYEARIWYVRSLVEQKKYSQVNEQLRSLNKKGLPEEYRSSVFLVSAYYYVTIGDNRAAIENIERAIHLIKRKDKAYYSFLLAQLYRKIGNYQKAMALFSRIEDMSSSYEMRFNAKISKAVAFSGGSNNQLLDELYKLLKNKKNKDYRDQIYYALANVLIKSGEEKKAIDFYWKSTQLSVNNDIQRSATFMALGDLYYKKQIYEKSYQCYDSCFFYNSSIVIKYKTLKNKYKTLAVLVKNLALVKKQDSLLYLANLPEGRRNEIIDKKVQKLKDINNAIKEQESKAALDRSFYRQSQSRSSSFGKGGVSSGAWYFYNVTMLSSGKSEFIRKWGRRKLEDNWNRKNKAIVDMVNVLDKEVDDEVGRKIRDSVGNPMSREYYIREIPITEEAKLVSHSLILESLFSIGELYSDRLNDYQNALRIYEDIIKRYPNNKYLLYIYYSGYNCAMQIGDVAAENKFRELVITNYPNSEYARLVNNPSYLSEMNSALSRVDKMYRNAYEMYEIGEFKRTVSVCNAAIIKYPNSALKDRFLLLKIYSIGKLISTYNLKVEIDKILDGSISSELRDVLNDIKKNLDAGAVVDKTISKTLVVKKDKIINKYKYAAAARHYVVIIFPRTGKNLNMLNYRLNVICGKSLEQSILEVRKEQLGLHKMMYVVSVLKNKEESEELMDIMVRDKRLAKELKSLDFRMFTISSSNYKILKYSESIDEYLKFYAQNYFDSKEDAYKNIGATSRSDMLFKFNKRSNHRFVLLYPYKDVSEDVVKILKTYDSDYEVKTEEYDSKYQAVIVDNIGASRSAMRYLKGAKHFISNTGIDIKQIKMMVITPRNYRVMYENKYHNEYEEFLENHYRHEKIEKKIADEQGFSYNADLTHMYVLVFSNKIKKKDLISAFRKYNSSNFIVESFVFDKKNNFLVVRDFSDMKKGMMYFRAVRSNKELYKAIKKTKYSEFIISERNYKLLSNDKMINIYKSLFNKWYLN